MTDQAKQKSRLIEPTHIEEPWTIIHLPTGDKLKVKHVVMGVHQMLDETGKQKFLDDGSPMYGIIHSQPVVGYIFPDDKIKNRSN